MLVWACSHEADLDALRVRSRSRAPCPALDAVEHFQLDLIEIRLPTAGCFFIDRAEVTVEQYGVFLAEASAIPAATRSCEWNDDLSPACSAAERTATRPDLPVTCVDYCDAAAFCHWAGKTLCAGDFAHPEDVRRSTWYAACAGPDRQVPYGGSFSASTCNGRGNPLKLCDGGQDCALVSAEQLTSCATPEGVLHLTGNLEEWVDACNGSFGASDQCLVRGGSTASQATLSCGTPLDARARDYRSPRLGFRCCVGSVLHNTAAGQ